MIRLTALAMLCLASTCHAYSGKELLEDCQAAESFYAKTRSADPYQSIKGARCLAYVAGFADGYEVSDYLAGQVGVQIHAFCLPDEQDGRQYRMVRAVLAHLEKQPPNSNVSPRTLVAGALSKAFPCGK